MPRPPRLRSRGCLLLTLRVAPPRSTFSFSACSPATKQRNRNPGGSAGRFHLNIECATNFFGTRIPTPHAHQGGTARDSHRQTFALMRSKLLIGILQKRAACSRTSEHPLPVISPYWEAIEPFLHVVKPGGINKKKNPQASFYPRRAAPAASLRAPAPNVNARPSARPFPLKGAQLRRVRAAASLSVCVPV